MTDKIQAVAEAYTFSSSDRATIREMEIAAFKAGAAWQKEHLFEGMTGTVMPLEPIELIPDPFIIPKLDQIIEMIQRQNQRAAGIPVDESGKTSGFRLNDEMKWDAANAEIEITVLKSRLEEAENLIGKWRLRAEDAEAKLIQMTKIATGAA